jgi:hypothetical protein
LKIRNKVSGSRVPCSSKYVSFRPSPQGDARHQTLAQFGDRGHVLEHGRAEPRRVLGKLVRSVQRRSGDDQRIVGRALLAEVKSFLLIGLTGGQFVADAEVAPPRPSPLAHGDLLLHLERLAEELAR